MPAQLVVVEGVHRGQEYSLEGKLLFDIGTGGRADIAFSDPEAAAVHCKLYRENDAFSVFDVSGRGFMVNGQRTVKAVLQDGDVMGIGTHSFKFLAPKEKQSEDLDVDVEKEPAPTNGQGTRGRRAELQAVKGNDAGKVFDLTAKDMFIIGRGIATDVTVWDIRASRVHCRIDHAEGGYQITDLNSSNGTWVNGKRAGSHRLRSGDYIKVGSTILHFEQIESA